MKKVSVALALLLITPKFSQAGAWDDLVAEFPAPKSVAADLYVHARLQPQTIQHLAIPLLPARASDPIPIGKTGYLAEFDLYWIPGSVLAPAFGELKFNARQINHQWVSIERGPSVYSFLDPESLNNADQATSFGHKRLVEPPFALDSITLFMHEVPGGAHASLENMMMDFTHRQGHGPPAAMKKVSPLLVTIALDRSGFRGDLQVFPSEFRIGYHNFDLQDPKLSPSTVHFNKRFLGTAIREPMTSEATRKIEHLLQLYNCGDLIKGIPPS